MAGDEAFHDCNPAGSINKYSTSLACYARYTQHWQPRTPGLGVPVVWTWRQGFFQIRGWSKSVEIDMKTETFKRWCFPWL